MDLSRTVAAFPDLTILDETPSTNDSLRASAADRELPDFSVVVTDNQTAGRGRLGRQWVSPRGQTLAISVLLKPRLPGGEALAAQNFGWLPLAAGGAMAHAIAALLPDARVGLKWPNDVQIAGAKVSGILAEIAAAETVIMGAGVNLAIPADALPTPVSTSLGLHDPELSVDELADAVLHGYLSEFRRLYEELLRFGGDADASGLRAELLELCSTLGQEVRVELPGGGELFGTAIDVDESGRLRVKRSADGGEQAVAAGDVTHLRYE